MKLLVIPVRLKSRTVVAMIFSLSTGLAGLATGAVNGSNCIITNEEEAILLALPYQEFDQDQKASWRKYADQQVSMYDYRKKE